MGFEYNKLIMSSFTKSQFRHCPLVWMFCSRTSMNMLNYIHEKCLRLITNDYYSNFNELLEWLHELSIHKTCVNYLMIEVCNYLHGLSLKLMTGIFTLQKNPYNIRNICLFDSENPRLMCFRVDAIGFRACQLWRKVPLAIKDSSLLEIFKVKIKLRNCDCCSCNL